VSYLLIALGSALGGMTRHWCTLLISARLDSMFPWGTVLVNVSGSLLIGISAALLDSGGDSGGRLGAAQAARDFVMVGLLGGYTTFSAFSLQTLQLLRQDRWGLAGANAAGSVFACLVAVGLGYWAVTSLQKSFP
jgi:CrcB protein